jgi:hypothetical protein
MKVTELRTREVSKKLHQLGEICMKASRPLSLPPVELNPQAAQIEEAVFPPLKCTYG